MEYEDMAFLLHTLTPSETFVDVGANIGAYTILASKVIGSKSISFEPLAKTAERLKDQIQINRIESLVTIKNMGVSSSEGELAFTKNNDTINKVSLITEEEDTELVAVTTLDDALDINTQYFLKIDVEGFEYQVIQGAMELLSSGNVLGIIIELNGSGEEFGYTNEDIHRKLCELSFTPVSYNPATRTLNTLNSYNRNSSNTIYVRNVEAFTTRCALSPKNVIHTSGKIKV
jgi:FkbM family methyltransferase